MPVDSKELEEVLFAIPDGGGTLAELRVELDGRLSDGQLRYRLGLLRDRGLVHVEGQTRAARYVPAQAGESTDDIPQTSQGVQPSRELAFSEQGEELLRLVRRPVHQREAVGYAKQLLERYEPNQTYYLSEAERESLHALGQTGERHAPAGTYAREVLEQLLIDLSWASSLLEGNTYTVLDTRTLIEEGIAAEGKSAEEAQMILNHKRAIELLVEYAASTDLSRYLLCNLHAALVENLMGDPSQAGQLRKSPVGIGGSVYQPVSDPHTLREYFELILALARASEDPFEQSFFLFVHIPMLQPFLDGNKRCARLACNIPFVRENLKPLTFLDVPKESYIDATLVWYEHRRLEPLRELYMWAYRRSAARYKVIRENLPSPDPFRLEHRDIIYDTVRDIVQSLDEDPQSAADAIAQERFDREQQRARFVAAVLTDLAELHEGNFMRYRLRPSEFEAWIAREDAREH